MRRYVKLSYNVRADTPLYPGTNPITIKDSKAISKGDSCNTSVVTLANHTGTHIDGPKHFWDSGRTISEYSLEELVFTKPLLIDCPKEAEDIIEIDDLEKLIDSPSFDLLLIRTGFQKYRKNSVLNENQKYSNIYCYKNPCLSPRAAEWIKDSFPNLRAIGIDCISIASYSHRELGRQTHRILLKEDESGISSLLIIEDLYLPYEINNFNQIIVSPLFIENVDSAPCTVIGIIDEIEVN